MAKQKKKPATSSDRSPKKVPNSPVYKKWWFWLIVGVVVIGGMGSLGRNGETPGTTPAKEESKTDSLEFLRKCTVMEAADIYETGIGGNKNTAFDDALETCRKWEREWNDFEEVVEADWKNRKDEKIEGKPLEHYLEILGW